MATEPVVTQENAVQSHPEVRPGMHIPAAEVELPGYHARIRAALTHSATKYYIDTSLLMWLLQISASARKQFFDWCDEPERNARIHVTTWCAHELYRHLRMDTVLGQIRTRISMQRDTLEDVLRFADQSCDDELCIATAYPNRIAAIEGLRGHASQITSYLTVLSDNRLKPVYASAVEEVRNFVNAHIAPTDALSTVASVSPEFSNRAEGRVPPGFQDEGKQQNAFGDFVFWREVLGHAEGAPVVILTNDRKNDWVHAASKVGNYRGRSLTSKSVAGAEAQYPHPILAFEAGGRGIQQLEVLNIAILASFLEMEEPNSVPLLVAAAYPRGIRALSTPDWRALGIERPPDAPIIDVSTVTLVLIRGLIPSARLQQILGSLGGTRQDVEAMTDTLVGELLQSLDTKGLVALGRGMFDAAVAHPGAISLSDILLSAAQVTAVGREALFLGMLLGIYFDADFRLRRTPWGDAAQGLFALLQSESPSPAMEQLESILVIENVWLLAMPTATQSSVQVDFDFYEDEESIQKLEGIAIAGLDVFDVASAEGRRLSHFFPSGFCSINDLLNLLSVEFTLPHRAFSTDVSREKSITWEASSGIGILRTDLRQVATDMNTLFEGLE